MSETNTQVRLAARPVGRPKPEDWSIEQVAVPQPGANEFLAKVIYISLDPAMRGWMNDVKSYIEPVGINEVMRAGGIAEIIESNNPEFAVGDHVYCMTPEHRATRKVSRRARHDRHDGLFRPSGRC